jgi:hypothetical protein
MCVPPAAAITRYKIRKVITKTCRNIPLKENMRGEIDCSISILLAMNGLLMMLV